MMMVDAPGANADVMSMERAAMAPAAAMAELEMENFMVKLNSVSIMSYEV